VPDSASVMASGWARPASPFPPPPTLPPCLASTPPHQVTNRLHLQTKIPNSPFQNRARGAAGWRSQIPARSRGRRCNHGKLPWRRRRLRRRISRSRLTPWVRSRKVGANPLCHLHPQTLAHFWLPLLLSLPPQTSWWITRSASSRPSS
jgi:hypothetical protein